MREAEREGKEGREGGEVVEETLVKLTREGEGGTNGAW